MSKPTQLRQHLRFTRQELPSLIGVFSVVAFLHVAGWGLFIHYNSNPAYSSLTDSTGALVYAGAGALAYSFGLRHAFDADHIAAIDDTTRLMLAKGKNPLALGLFFSLGHSTIVLALCIGVAFAARQAAKFQKKQAKTGKFSHQHLTDLLNERSLMRRVFKGAFKKGFDNSRQLYPVGVLFGLGFDTATEVALLALSATAAVGTVGGFLPPLAIIALPLIFAAGMTLMDSLDGIFMTKAYAWAFTSPLRKIYYNITTTGLSIFVAFVIGTIQFVGVLSDKTNIDNYQPFTFIASLDLNRVGYFIVASFVGAWLVSVLIWRLGRYEARYSSGIKETEHEHKEFKL